MRFCPGPLVINATQPDRPLAPKASSDTVPDADTVGTRRVRALESRADERLLRGPLHGNP